MTGRGVSRHRHPYDEVFVILEGAVRFWIGSEQIEAHGGQILVAPAGVAHRFINSGTGALQMFNTHRGEPVITEWL